VWSWLPYWPIWEPESSLEIFWPILAMNKLREGKNEAIGTRPQRGEYEPRPSPLETPHLPPLPAPSRFPSPASPPRPGRAPRAHPGC